MPSYTPMQYGGRWGKTYPTSETISIELAIRHWLFKSPVFPAIKITDSNGTTCIVRKKS